MEATLKIQELSQATGVSAKTIRFYEESGVLPLPPRKPNGYREYDQTDVDRLRLVAGARRLDLSLDDIQEILAMRDRREAPCRTMLERLLAKADEVAERIAGLQDLEAQLRNLHALGLKFPTDDVDGKNCVCHLVSQK
ncbi:MAG: MerR family transcriptional regulator [Chloroflexi bacterium]|jgi:DNA-binding transcriptional MerR regulator|nr:heavy metal-responsive transcriptional regulator [Anaerolinea sp.]TDA67078.1 MAG: MerR family transcriptional regulator [Chloroflexota bacterium]